MFQSLIVGPWKKRFVQSPTLCAAVRVVGKNNVVPVPDSQEGGGGGVVVVRGSLLGKGLLSLTVQSLGEKACASPRQSLVMICP